jgi:hypothetical protein
MAGAVFVGAAVGVVPTVVATGAQLTRKRIPKEKIASLRRKKGFVILTSPCMK